MMKVESVSAKEKGAREGPMEFKAEFQVLLGFMPDLSIIVNAKAKILAINDRVEEITGFKKRLRSKKRKVSKIWRRKKY